MPSSEPEWHYSRRFTLLIENDDDASGRGSCVAAKAACTKTGISNNSRLVLIKSSN